VGNVLVTGAGSGIGAATVAAFVRRGDAVVAAVRDPGRATVPGAEIITLDVGDDASVQRALSGRPAFDVVVNNAGISASGPVETADWELARAQFETNYWGALRVIRAVLPAMRARRRGTIINISTVGARTPARGYHAFYQGSKKALQAASEALAWELQPFGIAVALIEPGFVATNIFTRGGYQEAPPDSPYAEDEAWVRRFYLAGAQAHAIAAEEVAAAIVEVAGGRRPVLHQPVGVDARTGIATALRLDFEGWLEATLARTESLAGPRPLPPPQ
jgi:NAD(P)-dependent dehydrogenase (short-subunit alcohol dehydrogenase family)